MSRFELPPQYDPHAVERPLYRRWVERGVFTARVDSPKPPYVIVIPPPNVTAVLHMGQGLNNVTQDVLIRFERIDRKSTRLNSSHSQISYAVFCLKKKKDATGELRLGLSSASTAPGSRRAR